MTRSIRTRTITITNPDASDSTHTMHLVWGSVTRYVWLDEHGRDTHVAGDTVAAAELQADRVWGRRER